MQIFKLRLKNARKEKSSFTKGNESQRVPVFTLFRAKRKLSSQGRCALLLDQFVGLLIRLESLSSQVIDWHDFLGAAYLPAEN